MAKKILQVKPAHRIYKPSYPSYLDKNPLLYPETRPYPFSHKFIKWMSTGGLASVMLFTGCETLAQRQQDSLYNPFPLENAKVPYQPASFGTGMPERIRSEEARKVIRKAFSDSGIELQEKVWLDKENVGVFLDGYNHEEEIGFLFLDYDNMGQGFTKDRSTSPERQKQTKEAKEKQFDIKFKTKDYVETRKHNFLMFLEDKEKFMKNLRNYDSAGTKKEFADALSGLEPLEKSEKIFNDHYLQHRLTQHRANVANNEGLIREVKEHIDARFEDSPKKVILFSFARQFRRLNSETEEHYQKKAEEFKKLGEIKSDETFVKKLKFFNEFLIYNSGSHQLLRDSSYQNMKVEIMSKHPIAKWSKNTEELDEYYNRRFASLAEARQIDSNNKRGTQLIAPISLRDQLMIIPGAYGHSLPEELTQERRLLREEFNLKNGMTDEITTKQREEYKVISDKYRWSDLKDLPREERDSLQHLKQEETALVTAKYKAMEQLTDEERAAFKVKFDDLETRSRSWRAKKAEEAKVKVLRKLEKEVKMYIAWARSQMGG